MRTFFVVSVLAFVVAVSASAGQNAPPANPRGNDPTPEERRQAVAGNPAVQLGMKLYRERCAECHGADAKGVARHDLTQLWASGATDAQVFGIIRAGVPNTIMPSSSAPDEELRAIVAYLHSLNASAGESIGAGPAGVLASGAGGPAGERTFQTMCAGCHALNGRGGRLGPDLSRLGRTQSRQQWTTAIRNPDAAIANGYRAVTLVTRDGRRIRGAEKSEDAFSIQIMDTQQRLQGYLKADLREVVAESTSLMPAFGPDRLSDRDLDELLTFLSRPPGTP
jgi:putative heme-binding domain-containing protein